ncbi:COX15/CtaA family protein [Roseibacterium beibuensis]|uniref:Heme A synthase n=1 Tax=[Roseibacterium] beibuensis TaxID=1193142 RepID=A0ABP9LMX4_9RHOB|nr:heme A synthase [Roseibacterium beibuensis]MCS6626812.1 COX15/CtaA family protein [Roseibacterium beibuensis]
MAERRSIFEEVTETQKPAATPGGVSRDRSRARRLVRGWLMILFALVVVMIAVGGLTRLTDSGLSITEWAPLSGAIPPLSEADWQAEFDAYRAIPEYQLQNRGMSMAEFQVIYWWEWGHRQLGRFIGLVWAVGFLGLLATRNIPKGWTGRLLFLGALGGVQGAIGWWMVHSGLQEGMLDVASYRLATHLGLAFLILSLIAWYVMRLGREQAELFSARREGDRKLKGMSTGVMHLAFLQIIVGALVAGIDAGRNYTDWPLMAGGLTPPGMWAIEPVWRNLFENDGTVQFIHRMLGYLLVLVALGAWIASLRSARKATRTAFNDMMAMMVVQIFLGVVTVMTSATWYLAILHQFGAVVLMVLILRARFLSMYPLKQSVRG